MKIINLIMLMLFTETVMAQTPNFYLNGPSIRLNTFENLGRFQVKATLSNPHSYGLRIDQVKMVIFIPDKCNCPGQGGSLKGENKIILIDNPDYHFKTIVIFNFNIQSYIKEYLPGNPHPTVSFSINHVTAETTDGQDWIENGNRFDDEFQVHYNIKNSGETMIRKGGN